MKLGRLALVVALAAPRAALADLTVEEAWGVWTAQFEALGLDWQAAAEREGDALRVGPVDLSLTYPEAGIEVHLRMPGPRFVPVGEGVVVDLPAAGTMPFRVTAGREAVGSEMARGVFRWGLDSATVRMRDAGDAVETRWTGTSFEIELTEFTMLGAAFPAAYRYGQSEFDITQSTGRDDGWLMFAREGTAEAVIFEYGFGDQTTAEGLKGRVERGGVSTQTNLRLPAGGPEMRRLRAQAEGGMELRHRAGAKTGRDSDREWSAGTLIGSSQTVWSDIGSLFTLDGKGLHVVSGATDVQMQLTDEEVPMNVDLQAARVLLDLAMPVLRAPEPQDYALRFELDQLTLSNESWTRFFGERDVPRERIDVKLGLEGGMLLLETLLDLNAISQMSEETLPFTIETLKVSALEARMSDAALTGSGAVRLDHTDYDSLDGFPATTGRLTFDLNGMQGLLDRLTKMRLLSGTDAMSARMMLGMFTAPVEDHPDAARSEIEFSADGQIKVNGQRMR